MNRDDSWGEIMRSVLEPYQNVVDTYQSIVSSVPVDAVRDCCNRDTRCYKSICKYVCGI